jgi:rRNA-processing protein EBP2
MPTVSLAALNRKLVRSGMPNSKPAKRAKMQLPAVEDDDDIIEIKNDDDEDAASHESDSDAELQLALEQGLLQPGLSVQMDQPDFPYNQDEMTRLYDQLRQSNLDWLERMDVTCPPADEADLPEELQSTQNSQLVHDDFKREMVFFRQAQAAVKIAIPRLLDLKVAVHRPPDFFAEMAKSDDQMEKVRKRLQVKSDTAEKMEKIRHLRASKKLGKEIQREVEKKKLAEKKATNKKVDDFKRGKSKDLSGVLSSDEDEPYADTPVVSNKKGHEKSGQKKQSISRKTRDERYGHGGKKGKNRNDKMSFNDVPEESNPKYGTLVKKKKRGSSKGNPSTKKK